MTFKGQGYSSSSACPQCGSRSLEIVESRKTSTAFRRRKQCLQCNHRHTTFEVSSDWFREAERNARLHAALIKHLELPALTPLATPPLIPCFGCKLARSSSCDLELPEYGTEEAVDCIHFEATSSQDTRYIA
jgi:hypothetical protein